MAFPPCTSLSLTLGLSVRVFVRRLGKGDPGGSACSKESSQTQMLSSGGDGQAGGTTLADREGKGKRQRGKISVWVQCVQSMQNA
mmetsp:Transcript_6139/g.12137  ORF Transcript_6139/g.12137 Transcript_6139/m.12137 type:complete len:85 (-) Transcript_6139:1745-1999(-)